MDAKVNNGNQIETEPNKLLMISALRSEAHHGRPTDWLFVVLLLLEHSWKR